MARGRLVPSRGAQAQVISREHAPAQRAQGLLIGGEVTPSVDGEVDRGLLPSGT